MNRLNYTITARVMPAIICSIPILVIYYFFSNDEYKQFISFIFEIRWIDDLTFSVIVITLFSQINRLIAKSFFEKKLFKKELDMPTTQYLLHSKNLCTKEYRKKIYDKIFKDFHIKLLNKKQEFKNEIKARKLIVEAVGLIRAKVKDGRLLLNHNIEYGFFRNLVGGSVISLPMSLIAVALFFANKNMTAFYISIALSFFYIMILFFHKFVLNWFGERYAYVLFQEYLSTA